MDPLVGKKEGECPGNLVVDIRYGTKGHVSAVVTFSNISSKIISQILGYWVSRLQSTCLYLISRTRMMSQSNEHLRRKLTSKVEDMASNSN